MMMIINTEVIETLMKTDMSLMSSDLLVRIISCYIWTLKSVYWTPDSLVVLPVYLFLTLILCTSDLHPSIQ